MPTENTRQELWVDSSESARGEVREISEQFLFNNLKGDRFIWAIAALLAIFSFLPVYSAASNLAYIGGDGNTFNYFVKHFVHLFILEEYLKTSKEPHNWRNEGMVSTGNWRGYIATFTLIDKKLYLTDIKINTEKKDSEKKWKMNFISNSVCCLEIQAVDSR